MVNVYLDATSLDRDREPGDPEALGKARPPNPPVRRAMRVRRARHRRLAAAAAARRMPDQPLQHQLRSQIRQDLQDSRVPLVCDHRWIVRARHRADASLIGRPDRKPGQLSHPGDHAPRIRAQRPFASTARSRLACRRRCGAHPGAVGEVASATRTRVAPAARAYRPFRVVASADSPATPRPSGPFGFPAHVDPLRRWPSQEAAAHGAGGQRGFVNHWPLTRLRLVHPIMRPTTPKAGRWAGRRRAGHGMRKGGVRESRHAPTRRRRAKRRSRRADQAQRSAVQPNP
jgi:hypothetical protein